jgi:hypothetical protein
VSGHQLERIADVPIYPHVELVESAVDWCGRLADIDRYGLFSCQDLRINVERLSQSLQVCLADRLSLAALFKAVNRLCIQTRFASQHLSAEPTEVPDLSQPFRLDHLSRSP